MSYYSKDRIILIENNTGGWYEKAIFILNNDVCNKQKPKDIVLEAERIIREYMKKNKTISYPQKNKRFKIDWLLNCCLILSIILFIYCSYQAFL